MPYLIIFAIIVIVVLKVVLKNSSTTSSRTHTQTKRNSPKQSAENLGRAGEETVKSVIGRTISGQKYVFNDYVILSEEKTTQIDHIVVTECGVFVIETKNYSGVIYGSENQREWTQVLAGGNEKNKFYNPIKQNATHIYNLKKIVGSVPIKSVVVFVQGNTQFLQTDKITDLKDLKKLLYSAEKVLDFNQITTIAEKLQANDARAVVSNATHVSNIREQQAKIESNICPRCNSPLVLRKGKYGEFWGCSNYPKCKFIKK